MEYGRFSVTDRTGEKKEARKSKMSPLLHPTDSPANQTKRKEGSG